MAANTQNHVALRASRTAQLMAVQRGLESARPARTRLFQDPLAGRFVSPPWRVALQGARFVLVGRAIEAVYDLVGGPGPRASAVARTKLIDDLISEASPSIDQLVILGAGYDTRAHRLDCSQTALSTRSTTPTRRPTSGLSSPTPSHPPRRHQDTSPSTLSATTSPPL